MMKIELAHEADVPRILELSNMGIDTSAANFSTTPEPLESWLSTYKSTRERYPWLVARAAEGIVGFAKASPHRTRQAYAWTAEVSVYIDPAHHGRQIGTRLYDVLLPLLRRQGYVTLLAGIVGGHAASERLHEKAGFVRCGTFRRVGFKLARWHDVGYWELHLQPPDHVPGAILPVAQSLLVPP